MSSAGAIFEMIHRLKANKELLGARKHYFDREQKNKKAFLRKISVKERIEMAEKQRIALENHTELKIFAWVLSLLIVGVICYKAYQILF